MIVYTLPIIAAFTGWLTNYLAIKMLFHPKEKRTILFVEIQGIFPKRKRKLAEKLGKIVSNELFSVDDIKTVITKQEPNGEINGLIDDRIDTFLSEKLPKKIPMFGMFLNDKTKTQIKNVLLEEFAALTPEIATQYAQRVEESLDVEQIVYQKVVNFSSDKLEQILYSIMRKEFRFIEILGGILGFLIGLMQIALLQLR